MGRPIAPFCKNGHARTRTFGSPKSCAVCKREAYYTNRDVILADRKAKYAADPQKFMARHAAWHDRNRNAQNAKLNARNKTRDRSAQTREQQAKRLQRVPAWFGPQDRALCKTIYQISRNMSQLDNIEYHVDHVYPLQGRLVSGLHVPANLRIIPATDNMQKGNRV